MPRSCDPESAKNCLRNKEDCPMDKGQKTTNKPIPMKASPKRSPAQFNVLFSLAKPT